MDPGYHALFEGSDPSSDVMDAQAYYDAYVGGENPVVDLNFQRQMCILLRYDLDLFDYISRGSGSTQPVNGFLQPELPNLMNAPTIIDALERIAKLCELFPERDGLVMQAFAVKRKDILDGLVRMQNVFPRLQADVRGQIYWIIGYFIYTAASLPTGDEFQTELANNESHASLLCQIWLADDMNRQQIKPLTSMAMDLLLASNDARPPLLAALVSQVKDKKVIVDRLKFFLRTAMDRRPLAADGVSLFCNLMALVSIEPSLLPIFRSSGCSRLAIQALELLTNDGIPKMADPPPTTALTCGVSYLFLDFQTQERMRHAAQTLRSGFFPAFLKAFAYLKPTAIEPMLRTGERHLALGFFLHTFPENTSFYSFVAALADSVEALEWSDFQDVGKSSFPIIGECWMKFKNYLLERIIYRRIYDRIWKPKLAKQGCCDNVQCLRTDDMSIFKKCAGCKVALYCSKECQKAAWKGHKHDCATMSALKDPTSESSKHDVQFMKMLSEMLASRFFPTIKRIASKKYPELPFKDLAVTVDLTLDPAAFDVHPLKDALTDPAGNVRNVYESALRAGGHVTLIKTLSFASRDRMPHDGRFELSDRYDGPKSVRYATMPALDAFQVGVVKVKGLPVRAGSKGLTRFLAVDAEGMVMECSRDIVDDVANYLGFEDPLDWLKLPKVKPGDRLEALHRRIDEVIDLDIGTLIGPTS